MWKICGLNFFAGKVHVMAARWTSGRTEKWTQSRLGFVVVGAERGAKPSEQETEALQAVAW
jgi:hypothetical protein